MFKIFVNFKTYLNGTGEKAVGLAKAMEKMEKEIPKQVRDDKGIELIAIVQAVDLWRVKQETKLPVWVQHVDPFEPGKFTGFTSLEAVIEAGAGGTLLNHSEHPIPPGIVKQILARVRIKKTELRIKPFEVIVCAKTLGQIERLMKLKPDYIAYEVTGLIGGNVSISEASPKAITHAVELCGSVPLLVGAGISKGEDLATAKDLGAAGVLVANAVVNADEPEEKLRSLLGIR